MKRITEKQQLHRGWNHYPEKRFRPTNICSSNSQIVPKGLHSYQSMRAHYAIIDWRLIGTSAQFEKIKMKRNLERRIETCIWIYIYHADSREIYRGRRRYMLLWDCCYSPTGTRYWMFLISQLFSNNDWINIH